MSFNHSSHPTGNITTMLSTTPHNPCTPIKRRGGTGTSKPINFSSITTCDELRNTPAITRATPTKVPIAVILPSVMLPDIRDTRSALLPPIKTLTTIQNTPTQWNLYSKFFKTQCFISATKRNWILPIIWKIETSRYTSPVC